MCALRDTRALPPASLASQYRLAIKPKRPPPKRVERRRKEEEVLPDVVTEAIEEEEVKNAPDAAGARNNSIWLASFDDFDEEFDFDADDDVLSSARDQLSLPQRTYISACTDLKRRPVTRVLSGLVTNEIICRGLILHEHDVKACTIALVGTSIIEKLVFDANNMGPVGGVYFADVIRGNTYVTSLRLSDNDLGSEGAKAICSALEKNSSVRHLDLSGNGFKEEDAVYFKALLEENIGIRELYLGHNHFREKGGEILAEGLVGNDVLRVLHLQWNHLRRRGACAIGKAMMTNSTVEELNLSWNGLYLHGAATLAKALGVNQTLTHLDLTCNRLTDFCVGQLLAGLQHNTTLTSLKLPMNHISHETAYAILCHIKKSPAVALEFIDLGDQPVKENFEELLRELKKARQLEVVYGIVWRKDRELIGASDENEDEIALLNENPIVVLMEFMRLQNLRLIDLFNTIDKDKDKSLSLDEVRIALQEANIPLKSRALQYLIRSIDVDGSGDLDYAELVEAQNKYKERIRNYVRNNVPIMQTDIGRVAMLLRKIIATNMIQRQVAEGTY